MIKLNDIIEQYGDYEVDEEKLKEILIKPAPKSVWDLKHGDKYYNIVYTADGFRVRCYRWGNILYDREARDIGNVFLTEEEAEFEIERRKVEAILLKYGRRNWKYHKNNFIIHYGFGYTGFGRNKLIINDNRTIGYQGTIYFDTEELCEQAIKEAGKDNIIKYIFGVDEDGNAQADTEEN